MAMETSKMKTKKKKYVLVVFVIPSVYHFYPFQKVYKYSEWLLFNAKWTIFSYIMARTSYISILDFYSASSLKQQSVAILVHIILIPSQPVVALSP